MFHNRVLLPIFEVLICIFLMLFATCLPVQRKNPVITYKRHEFYYLGNIVNIQ
jgi:hypothetical protein